MNLRETLNDLKTGTYTVTRQAQPTLVKGRVTGEGSASVFLVDLGVQPATGKDVDFFPEVVRQKEMKVCYSPMELLVARDGFLADVITIKGEDFQVVNSREWDDPDGEDGNLWVIYAAKVKLS